MERLDFDPSFVDEEGNSIVPPIVAEFFGEEKTLFLLMDFLGKKDFDFTKSHNGRPSVLEILIDRDFTITLLYLLLASPKLTPTIKSLITSNMQQRFFKGDRQRPPHFYPFPANMLTITSSSTKKWNSLFQALLFDSKPMKELEDSKWIEETRKSILKDAMNMAYPCPISDDSDDYSSW